MKLRTLFGLLTLLCSTLLAAEPYVSLPNGELIDRNTDLRVKVLGGSVAIERTWMNGRWYLNPSWAALKFKLDRSDSSVLYVDRIGSVYERTGNGTVYQFDDDQFIRREATGWVWFDRLGNTMHYNDDGVLQHYRNRSGVLVSLEYNAAGQLLRVRDHFGTEVLSVSYTGTVLANVRDYSNRTVHYVYQGALLKEVRNVDNERYLYEYNGDGQLNKVTDPELRVTKITYASSYPTSGIAVPPGIGFSGRAGRDFRVSRVGTFENAEQEKTVYDYDFSRNAQQFSVVMTTPEQRKIESRFDMEGRMVSELNGTTLEFDRRRDGEFIEYIKNERGLITKYEYDSYRNVLNVEHPDNSVESWTYLPTHSYISSYTDAHGTRETYRYNATGHMIEKREAVGTELERLTTYTYDAYGQLKERNERANLTAVDPILDAVTKYTFDNFGNMTEMTDPENNRTQYQDFDAMGNAWTVIDARNKRRTMQFSKQGWLLQSTSALGFVSTQTYNKVGERKSSTTPIDATRTATTTYEYDKAGRLVKTIDPQNGESLQRYDDEGRLVESEDARGVITAMAYDNRGRMSTLTDGNKNVTETIYGDKSNALEGLVAERKYPTYTERFNYDKRDRMTVQTQVLSANLSYQSETRYDGVGNVVTQIDAKGRTSIKEYDLLNRLIQETDPLLGRTKYAYDRRNNLLSVTDANENTHTFTYDRLNRKLTEKRPMGETIRYEYDENGNLTQRISPNGAKRIYTFDDDNRLTKEEHYLPKATTASKTMTYEYDRRGLLTGYDDGLTSGVYVHNLKGEKESETITFGKGAGAFSKTLTRTYEANGLLKTLTYPGTIGSNQYTYDSNNQLKTYEIPGLAAGNNTLTYSYRWNAIKEITMPGNLKRTVTLDPLQRPERIFVKSATPTIPAIMDHRYQYDEVSNIKKKTTLDGDYVYDYDELDRLTAATPPLALQQSASNPDGLPVEAYSYDPVHNRISSAHQPGPWVYNANNELSEWGLESEKRVLSYDDNGSTVKEELGGSQITDYVYDAQDRLIEVKRNNSVVAKYAYDPMGRRIWREAQESVTWFLYSDEGLIQEISGANQAIRTYGWNPGGLWGTDTIWQKDANGTFLTHNDHLYTTDVLTKADDGNKAWRAIRESFGKTAVQAGNLTDYLMRFPGQWEDEVSKLSYNLKRDFHSSSNYLQVDPGLYSVSSDAYGYSGFNPIKFIDPYGLCKLEIRCNLLSAGPILGQKFSHCFIILTMESNVEYYYRGGPSKSGGSMLEAWKNFQGPETHGDSGFGTIVTEYGIHKPGAIDWPSFRNPETGRKTVYDDYEAYPNGCPHCTRIRRCECLSRALVEVIDSIEAAKVWYNPFMTNSNATVSQTISSVGLNPGLPPAQAPGWLGNVKAQRSSIDWTSDCCE